MPADQRAGDAPAGPEGGDVFTVSGEVAVLSFCSDGLECCSLKWAIGDMDDYLDGLPDGSPAGPPVVKMRNWLADQYNEYASGERECSRCRKPGPPRPDPSKNPSVNVRARKT